MSKLFKILCVALLAGGSAFAQAPAKTTSTGLPLVGDAWLGAGVWMFHVSSDFGSDTTSRFGLHGGGDFGVRLSDSLSGVAIADLAVAFGSNATIVPITLGAGVRLDHSIPVIITAGLGFVLDTGFPNATPVGLGVLAQAYYPLPNMPTVQVGGQLAVHVLNDSLTDFVVNGGVQFTFL
jgi:hypothetical protein